MKHLLLAAFALRKYKINLLLRGMMEGGMEGWRGDGGMEGWREDEREIRRGRNFLKYICMIQ